MAASPTEYVTHHLEHLAVGEGFWTLHIDTLFWSWVTGLIFLGVFYGAARAVTAGVPGKMQNFVESILEFVDKSVSEAFHGPKDLLAPLALTIFVWVFLWNLMDLIPVDLFPVLAAMVGIEYMRVVPSADMSATFSLSLSVLVLIASMNITSGLIMLVKNKGRDIGILRTMGLTEGSILRVFFLCGSLTGIVGTIAGVILGCLFAINIDAIFSAVNYFAGGGVWDPSIRGIYRLPAKLEFWDVASAVGLSLTLSFLVTLFPARKAARMNPVEALRYE